MDVIKIDLRERLTDAAVKQALPHLGECAYSAPCIIGACMTEADLQIIKVAKLEKCGIHTLADGYKGVKVEFATAQQSILARRLQTAFDRGRLSDKEDFMSVVKEGFISVVQDVRSELDSEHD